MAKCLGSCLSEQSNFVDSWHEERGWTERPGDGKIRGKRVRWGVAREENRGEREI